MNPLLLILLILMALHETDPQEEQELLQLIRNGDHDAFERFFKKYHAYLYHYLLKRGVGEQQAEDLVQQAFIMIWDKRRELETGGNLRAFLFRIAYTRMLNVFRDTDKFDQKNDVPELPEGDEADREIRNDELRSAIERAISSLPGKRQDVFRLCYVQEFTYRQAGEILGISEKTVENHMGLALKDLRSRLRNFL